MAGQLTKLAMFLLISHLLFYTAGQAGYIENQGNDNIHKDFINIWQNDQLKDNMDISRGDSGVIEKINSVFLSIPLIGDIYNVLFGPYLLIGNISLPFAIKALIQGVMGILETTTMILLIRGVRA